MKNIDLQNKLKAYINEADVTLNVTVNGIDTNIPEEEVLTIPCNLPHTWIKPGAIKYCSKCGLKYSYRNKV